MTLLTEALSVPGWLAPPALLASWGLLALAAGLLLWRKRGGCWERPRIPRCALPFALPLGAILLITGLLAVVSWPNSWDGHTYQLVRPQHWLMQGSIAPYASHLTYQVVFPPWAGYGLLNLWALGGDERVANLLQWLSLVGCVVGVSLVARQLAAGLRGQWLAALVCATMPMAVLQASGTQYDLVVSFWLVCLTSFLLRWRSQPGWWPAVAIGLALGLATFTKGTAYAFALPLLVLLAPWSARRAWRRLLGQAALIGSIFLVLNLPFLVRNNQALDTPLFARVSDLASEDQTGSRDSTLINKGLSPALLFSNLVRNAALHLGTPNRAWNGGLRIGIRRLHASLGIDPDARESTWSSTEFTVPAAEPDEHHAGNQLHLLALVVALGALVASRPLRGQRGTLLLAASVVAGFVLFCALLKWQPFHSRLHLPLFILAAPVIALTLGRWRRAALLLAAILVLQSLPYLLLHESKPLLGQHSVFFSSRADQLFRERPSYQEAYLTIAERLGRAGCVEVGLILANSSDWEYPFWVLIGEAAGRPVRLEHVGLTNRLADLEARRSPFQACGIISTSPRRSSELELDGRRYQRVWSKSWIQLFLAQPVEQAG